VFLGGLHLGWCGVCEGHAAYLSLLLPPWPPDMIGGLHGECEHQSFWYETGALTAGLGVHRDLQGLVTPFLGQRHGQRHLETAAFSHKPTCSDCIAGCGVLTAHCIRG